MFAFEVMSFVFFGFLVFLVLSLVSIVCSVFGFCQCVFKVLLLPQCFTDHVLVVDCLD